MYEPIIFLSVCSLLWSHVIVCCAGVTLRLRSNEWHILERSLRQLGPVARKGCGLWRDRYIIGTGPINIRTTNSALVLICCTHIHTTNQSFCLYIFSQSVYKNIIKVCSIRIISSSKHHWETIIILYGIIRTCILTEENINHLYI